MLEWKISLVWVICLVDRFLSVCQQTKLSTQQYAGSCWWMEPVELSTIANVNAVYCTHRLWLTCVMFDCITSWWHQPSNCHSVGAQRHSRRTATVIAVIILTTAQCVSFSSIVLMHLVWTAHYVVVGVCSAILLSAGWGRPQCSSFIFFIVPACAFHVHFSPYMWERCLPRSPRNYAYHSGLVELMLSFLL